MQNTDLLTGILISLRTGPAQTTFRWVRGHEEDNNSNKRADAPADTGRENDIPVRLDDEEWIEDHPSLQDGARLQEMDGRHTYRALLIWHTKWVPPILHQGTLDEAKEELKGLRSTNGKLLKVKEPRPVLRTP